MKKKLSLLILIALIVLGGCGMNNKEENVSPSEMNEEDLPDVPAFQDEFTREFLQSTEPVREGFYPFLSKSDSFTMDFPEDMVISSRSHNIGPDNRSETVSLGYADTNGDLYTDYTINYTNFMADEENSKSQMSKSASRELEFKRYNTNFDNQYLDIAKFTPSKSKYSILALVWNENHQELQIFTTITCNESLATSECKSQVEQESKRIEEQLKSIKLINSERE